MRTIRACGPLLLTLAFCFLAVSTSAQSGIYTPKPGSLERKLLMDTLRPAVESDLRRPVIFVVENPKANLRVCGGWAFVLAGIRQPSGAYLPSKMFSSGMFSGDADGLLRRVHGRWRLVAHDTGPTDVAWVNWQRVYHTPPDLVPNQE